LWSTQLTGDAVLPDLDVLLELCNYPAEHWIHLRTTDLIESTPATVRHRTKVTKGPCNRAAGLATAFKLIEAAQARWRAGWRRALAGWAPGGFRWRGGA